jgi:hypothetical protein
LVSTEHDRRHAEEPAVTLPVPPAFTDLTRRGQEAATAAAEGTARALRTYTDAVTPRGPRPQEPRTVATATFDLAGALLDVQRSFVTTSLDLWSDASDAATEQASRAGQDLKARTDQAAERVLDLTTQAQRRAAGAVRNGVGV